MIMDTDLRYEYNAPRFVDFNSLDNDCAAEHEKYFDVDHEKMVYKHDGEAGTAGAACVSGEGRQSAKVSKAKLIVGHNQRLADKKAGQRDNKKKLMSLRRSGMHDTDDTVPASSSPERDPAPAKKLRHCSEARQNSAISRNSGSVNKQELHLSGVSRARLSSTAGHARSSPRMLRSTEASRSGARKLRSQSCSARASSHVTVSSGGQSAPAESLVRPSQPASRTQECSSANLAQRLSQPRSKSSVSGEVDFASLLRRSDSPPKPARARCTKPQPFNLTYEKKRKLETESKEQYKFSKEQYKFDTPLGEKVLRFTTKTPERFRSKIQQQPSVAGGAYEPHLCIPKTPNLMTKRRTRKVTAPSQVQLEEIVVEEMKNHQFKANPVNKTVLSRSGLGVKLVAAKPATVVQPFKLSLGLHHRDLSTISESDTAVFHAKPAPKEILAGVVGVGEKKEAPLTMPQSPSFHPRKTRSATESSMVEGGVKLTLAHPVPSFENPFRPQLQRIEVETKPFSFDSRTQEMFQRREERLNSIIEEEQKLREFHARPMPDLNFVDEFKKPQLETTKPMPYNLRVDARGQQKLRKNNEKLQVELEEQHKACSFQAQPATVLQELPFEPQHTRRSPIKAKPFRLQSDIRAEKRAEFDRHVQELEVQVERQKQQRENERQEMEERAAREARATTVHAANPIRHYKPLPQLEILPLTMPQSPVFSDRLSKSSH